MSDWVVSNITNGDEVSSIVPNNNPAPSGSAGVPPQSTQPQYEQQGGQVQQPPFYQNQQVQPTQVQPQQQDNQEDSTPITSLGSSYKINSTVVQKTGLPIPSWLIAVIVIVPLVIIFILSAIANRDNNKPEESFLFKTLESKYFTLNYSPDYEATSIIDKKVPFIEKHDLTSTLDGEKHIQILVKDIKFDYSLDNNINVKARRENRELYSEEKYELNYKEGLYFKKRSENFEHLILLVDRAKSVLYEITIKSPSSFADDEEMQVEVKEMLNSVTFL